MMVESTIGGLASYAVYSRLGTPEGDMLGSIASGVASGAAMGAIAGAPVIGAVIGGASGLINGGTQIEANKDEAFKSAVQEQYDAISGRRAEELSTGTSIAAQRELDKIAFDKILKRDSADTLEAVKTMANTTPFLYEDLKGITKTLATYGTTDPDAIKKRLTQIGDTGAALGMSSADMSMVATGLGRMQSSGKTTLEYLNLLIERGIPAIDYLAEAMGATNTEVYNMVSKGLIPGAEAAEIIANAMGEANSGAMAEMAETYSGLMSTKEGLEQELQASMGAGFTETRTPMLEKLNAQLDPESELGQKMNDLLDEMFRKLGFDSLGDPQASAEVSQWFGDISRKDLESTRRAWREMLQKANAGAQGQDSTRRSIQILPDGKRYVSVDTDQNLFEGASNNEALKIARRIILDKFQGKVLPVESNAALVNRRSAEEYTHPAKRIKDEEIRNAKMRSAPELDHLLSVSEYLRYDMDDGRHPDAAGGWDVYRTTFEVGGQFFTGEVKIKITPRGRLFYDITQIEKAPRKSGSTSAAPASASGNLFDPTVPQTKPSVNSHSTQKEKNIPAPLPRRQGFEGGTNWERRMHGEATQKLLNPPAKLHIIKNKAREGVLKMKSYILENGNGSREIVGEDMVRWMTGKGEELVRKVGEPARRLKRCILLPICNLTLSVRAISAYPLTISTAFCILVKKGCIMMEEEGYPTKEEIEKEAMETGEALITEIWGPNPDFEGAFERMSKDKYWGKIL